MRIRGDSLLPDALKQRRQEFDTSAMPAIAFWFVMLLSLS